MPAILSIITRQAINEFVAGRMSEADRAFMEEAILEDDDVRIAVEQTRVLDGLLGSERAISIQRRIHRRS